MIGLPCVVMQGGAVHGLPTPRLLYLYQLISLHKFMQNIILPLISSESSVVKAQLLSVSCHRYVAGLRFLLSIKLTQQQFAHVNLLSVIKQFEYLKATILPVNVPRREFHAFILESQVLPQFLRGVEHSY